MPTISASLCGDGEDVPAWGPRPARELCIAEDVEHVRVDERLGGLLAEVAL